jgi:hypothetical protein
MIYFGPVSLQINSAIYDSSLPLYAEAMRINPLFLNKIPGLLPIVGSRRLLCGRIRM